MPLLYSLPPNDVIVTTACLAFWKYDDIDEIVEQMHRHLGKNFFLEVQYHHTDKQREINRHILDVKAKLNIPLIMGCDSHYILMEEKIERESLLLAKNMEYGDEEGWFMDYPSGEEAYERFIKQGVLSPAQIEEAMNNTNVFLEVEQYNSPVFTKDIKMPTLYPDKTQDEKDAIYENLVWEKWNECKNEIPSEKWAEYEKEIRYEVDIVKQTFHSDYFLVDYEIVKEGKRLGGVITATGRGSSVSFITNKLLGFTDVDRIAAKVKMYPERFMSPTRILEAKTLADLDLNLADPAPFAQAQINVLGENHSAPMVSYGTLRASAAWKMYARAQNVDFETANSISEQIRKYELDLKHADLDEKDEVDIIPYIGEKYRDIYTESTKYLGLIADWKIAPCSYLLYQKNIRREVGLVRTKEHICCAMDGKWAEEYKFLKNDLLRVAVVQLIHETYERIEKKQHTVNELLEICTPTNKVWDIYKKSCTLGINQVEQQGTARRAAVYKPQTIPELCAFIAAIRPGFKSMYKTFETREPFDYGIPTFDNLIQTPEMPFTFVLYQEMSMAALNFAGIPLSECYEIVKNIAKKRTEKVLKYKDMFISGFKSAIAAAENKTESESQEIAERIWQILEDSSAYSFNACLAEDTIIQRVGFRSDKYNPTIGEMYKIKTDQEYAIKTGHKALHDKYKSRGYGNALSMYDDMRIYKNNIVGIYPAGTRDVYKVISENGKSIVCTDNHKFPTPCGIKHLSELKVGDQLYVKGGYEKNKTNYNFTNGIFATNVPQKGELGFQKNPNGNSVLYNNFRNSQVCKNAPCKLCGVEYSDAKRFEVHHKDFNRYHNAESNYLWCCVSCHKKEHYKNGRKKAHEKGYPTQTESITDIIPVGRQETYDVEMADPAHTVVSEGGIVASNSHSYSVALDSLYCAYLKSHYPLAFYETFLRLLEIKGEKDRMIEVKKEAEDHFRINFPAFKFGQDNRTITADTVKNEITNSLISVKEFNAAAAESLYELSKSNYDSFVDMLLAMKEQKIQKNLIDNLIKIEYFSPQFGNQRELLRIRDMFDFFKGGEAKLIKKDSVDEAYAIEIIKRYSKQGRDELKSYELENDITATLGRRIADLKKQLKSAQKQNSDKATSLETEINTVTEQKEKISIEHARSMMVEFEGTIKKQNLPDLDFKLRIQNQADILGYSDLTTGRDEDRKTLLIEAIFPQKKDGQTWGYAVYTRSLGSGKTARLTVKQTQYERKPIEKNNIIVAVDLWKNKKGYWYLEKYERIG